MSSSSSPPPPPSSPPVSLMEEMTNSMALSMLIFLIADMRLMSATGRIRTRYETIALDSDLVSRANADSLAGVTNKIVNSSIDTKDGLSPAQLMAIVLMEMKRSFDAKRAQEKEAVQLLQDEHSERPAEWMSMNAKKNRKDKVREDDMHALLKAYAQMIDKDRKMEIDPVMARSSLLEFAKGSKKDNEEMKSIEEEEEAEDEEKQTEEITGVNEIDAVLDQMRARADAVQRQAEDMTKQAKQALPTRGQLQRAKSFRKNVMTREQDKTEKQMEQVTDALFQMGKTNEGVRQSVHASLAPHGRTPSRALSEDELLLIMGHAVESREYGKLDFMADFFRNGTVCRLMVESNVRFVWINDWYPLKDLTYSIAVDAVRKRVLVVFRGAITKQDWSKASDSRLQKVKNPIKEDFEEKSEEIGIHNGFYQYLFRPRRDTGTTKFDEVANMAHMYGMERIGEEYSLAVVGHSLGAALSTVFCFFASTDERFTRNGPIQVFTFGSPYVGGHTFADSFMHQEKSGKLMYARFYNHNDFVAHVPANFAVTKRGSMFRHVGIDIKIPPVSRFNRKSWSPQVSYIGKEGFWASYRRGIGRNFLLHTPLLWKIAQMHTLAELLSRIMEGQAQSNDRVSEGYDLLQMPIEKLYEEFSVLPAKK